MRTRSNRAVAVRLASARRRTRETQPEAGGRSRPGRTTGVGEGACQAGVGQGKERGEHHQEPGDGTSRWKGRSPKPRAAPVAARGQ